MVRIATAPVMAVSLMLALWLGACPRASAADAGEVAAPQEPQTAQALTPPTPAASAPALTNADRLTALVVRALPLGEIAQVAINRDPKWPFLPARIDSAQLHCMQQRMLPAGFLENRRQAVAAFIQQHPDQVQDAIDVLAQGGADVVSTGIQVGVQAFISKSGDANSVEAYRNALQGITPDQMSRFLDLALNHRYKSVRELLFFGNDQFPSAGNEDTTKLIAGKWLLEAMGHCQIPVSALNP